MQNVNLIKFENIFAGNEHHRGITANGKFPHYLEKNKSFNHDEHTKGIKSQGLSPLRQKTNEEEADCIYGGIDFDFEVIPPAKEFCKFIYNISPELFVFESKSSGYHVYWFASDWIKAGKMKAAMDRLKKQINPKYKADRVIPYETKLKDIKKQCGFWFNVPYFANTRRCLNHLGDPLEINQFELKYKLRKHHFLSAIVGWKAAKKGQENSEVGRHQVLWRAALYQKYRMPDEEKILDEINNCFNPPIEDEREIEHAKDLGEKDEEHLDRNLKNYFKEIGIEEKIQEPPKNFFEGAAEYEDFAFNPGSRSTDNGPKNNKKDPGAWRHGILAKDLEQEKLKPIEWVVEGLIAPGLNLIAGKSKIGKSWLVLWLAYAVELGLEVLGFKCTKGKVLHYSLEDGKSRTKNRWKVMGIKPQEANYQFRDRKPRIPLLTDGLEEEIDDWIVNTANAKLVIIDVYVKVKKTLGGYKLNAYENDNFNLQDLQTLATKYEIAIVLVHHLKKIKADDVFDEITGSAGIQSNMDSMIVISSDRTKGKNPILSCIPKDAEQQEFEIALNGKCIWENLGQPGSATLTNIQNAIINTMNDGVERSPMQIIILLQENHKDENWGDEHIRKEITRSVEKGTLFKTKRGHYKHVPF